MQETNQIEVKADKDLILQYFSKENWVYPEKRVNMTRNQINDTFLFQNRVKVVGEVSEKWN